VLDDDAIHQLQNALDCFHQHCKIFKTSGVWEPNTHPPWQHALMHYAKLICDFGVPNRLYSSIMESKHIKAVKKP
jgi:hypothetical protein